ncbi:hypothetical protein F4811DRAFT_516221 [Daldinia bambusicola]|nr:hypothetical protein F4811DRAFT_516221 [Daldinia bambusicola]
MWLLSKSILQAWLFELNLFTLQALVPYNNKNSNSLIRHIRTLIAICFNGAYIHFLKKKAIQHASDPEMNGSVWSVIYACLFSMFVCAFRTTYNHFTQTTASLKPSHNDLLNCHIKTETRRLVPVYRVSYPAFRFLDTLARSFQEILHPPTPLRNPPLIQDGRINISGSFRRFILGPILRFPSAFPGISNFIRANNAGIVNVLLFIHHIFFNKNTNEYLFLVLIHLTFRFQHVGPEFLWSLIYHDALEVDGTYYEVRSTTLFSPRLEVRIKPMKGSSIEKYKRDRQELGYTFYNQDEIEAKARHLGRIVPNYDHLTYNCQAFVQNLFRRIVAHELPPRGKKPARQRTLHGYHNQRGNILILLAIYARHFLPSLKYILWLPWVNYWYEFIIFTTCSWHGKPASNRVALFQLLASFAFMYVFDWHRIPERASKIFPHYDPEIAGGKTDANMLLSWFGWMSSLDFHLGILAMPIACVNILVKLYFYDQHCDKGLPRIMSTPWHKGFGFEGMEIEVKHFMSDKPIDGYYITPLGLIPKVDHAQVEAAAEDTGFDKSAAARIHKGFHMLAEIHVGV